MIFQLGTIFQPGIAHLAFGFVLVPGILRLGPTGSAPGGRLKPVRATILLAYFDYLLAGRARCWDRRARALGLVLADFRL